ncbi:MAG: hypothetical protein R6T85_08050 [Egibacteraceae bacterium]
MADLEERLRASLHERAGDVGADGERAEAVRRRVLRRRRVRSAAPLVATAAVILASLAVVPSWLASPTEVASGPESVEDSDDVAADVGDEAEGLAEAASPGPGEESSRGAPGPEEGAASSDADPGFAPAEVDPLAALDGVDGLRQRLGALSLLEQDGPLRVAGGDLGPLAGGPPGVGPLAVAARPDMVAVAYRLGPVDAPPQRCLDALVLTDVATDDAVEVSTSCPGPAAFAPDGRHLAWIDDRVTLRAVELERALDGDAVAGSWPLAADGDLAVRGWLDSDQGWRLVVAEATAGADRLHVVPFGPADDGTLALPAGRGELDADDALERHGLDPLALAPADPASARLGRVDLLGLDASGEVLLRRGALGSEGRRDLTLDGEVAAALDADGARPWLTSRGRDTVLGDGRGGVWHVRHPVTSEGAAEVTELSAAWAAGALLPLER